MASAVYPKGIITIMSGGINLASLNIQVALLDLGVYTYNSADQYRSSLSGVIALSGNLASKTIGVVGTGVFDAADITYTAPTSGHTAHMVVPFVARGGASSADDLLSYNELTADVVTNGGDVTLQFASGGIFSL